MEARRKTSATLRSGLAGLIVGGTPVSWNPFPLLFTDRRSPLGIVSLVAVGVTLALITGVLVAHQWALWAAIPAAFVILLGPLFILYYFLRFLYAVRPNIFGAELGVAAALYGKGKRAEALGFSRRYIERRPQDAAGWWSAAGILLGLRNYDEALKHADRAIELGAPNEAYAIRAAVFAQYGLYEEACEEYAAVGDKLKSLPQVYANYGSCLAAVRRLERAEAVLQGAASLAAGPEAHLALGVTYRLLGRAEEASTEYLEAARRAETRINQQDSAESILAYCLASLSRSAEAQRAAESALRKRRHDPLALWGLAATALRQGNADRAYEAIAEMLGVRPVSAMFTLMDPLFTPLLNEKRFRELLAWALGAQRQARERVLARLIPPA